MKKITRKKVYNLTFTWEPIELGKVTRKSDPDDIWRIKRALKVYAEYLDNVFGDKRFGDAYRDIATRVKVYDHENN